MVNLSAGVIISSPYLGSYCSRSGVRPDVTHGAHTNFVLVLKSQDFRVYESKTSVQFIVIQTFYCRFVLLLRSSLRIFGIERVGPSPILFTDIQTFSLMD